METINLEDDQKLVCPYCEAKQLDKAKYYVIDHEMGKDSLARDRCETCLETFECWRDVAGTVKVAKISEGVVILPADEPIKKTNWLKTLILLPLVLLAYVLWLQPWESPTSKVLDEWRACNHKYNDKCSYIGPQYKTGSLEMSLSTFFYGEADLKKLRGK